MSTHLVITGASGFLGSAVVRAARAAGCEVVPVARKALPAAVRVESYADAPVGEVLVHLAENNDRAEVQRLGADYARCASETAQALLGKGYGRVVYVSSAALYGQDATTPRTPAHPTFSEDVYSRTKREIEQMMLATGAAVVVRLANVYGPGMSAANVVSAIIRQIPGADPLVVRDTRPVRDFVWLDDAADALVAMATGPGSPGVYNVGSGVGCTIHDLARRALRVAGEDGREVRSSGTSGQASYLVLDIADTTREWGWRPVTSLDDGLARLVAQRSERSAE